MTIRVQAQPDYSDIDSAVKHRYAEKFRENLPAQVEHCLRLTLERLQGGLYKDNPKPMTNPEVACLAQAANHLYDIYYNLR